MDGIPPKRPFADAVSVPGAAETYLTEPDAGAELLRGDSTTRQLVVELGGIEPYSGSGSGVLIHGRASPAPRPLPGWGNGRRRRRMDRPPLFRFVVQYNPSASAPGSGRHNI